MAYKGIQYVGIITAFLGWLGVVVACSLPHWKVTPYITVSSESRRVIWEGIWKICEVLNTGNIHCVPYYEEQGPSTDLLVIRALILVSISAGIIGIMMFILGGKCTKCIENSRVKPIASILAGVSFIISGVLGASSVSWTAYGIIKDFHDPLLMNEPRRELGASLYIGWIAAGFLLVGGVLVCLN
ncbi:claudin-4-like [Clarias gariepinus]|uniref:claudin-4-like n=1 Tax=Clarias gariepinus TaxID=13013 RepID=UPI00234C381D|nr:claudin-4-like [Clarias gariepinus]